MSRDHKKICFLATENDQVWLKCHLDENYDKLSFKQHIDIAISKVNKGISVRKKLRHNLPRKSLVTIYKALLRLLIDYSNIVYGHPQNKSFCEKIEFVQYKYSLAITGAIQGTCRDNIYQESGLESLKSRRWYKRLACMFKIMNEEAPSYLINLIPKYEPTVRTRNNSIPSNKCRTNCFKHSFFPSICFGLDINTRNLESFSLFKCRLLSIIRPSQNSIYNIVDLKGLKFLTRFRLDLSHLNAHRCRHPEDTSQYLLHCHHFSNHRADLLNSVKFACDNFESRFDNVKKNVLLYSDSRFDEVKNRFILEAIVTYIKNSERFSGFLFD